VEGAYPAPEKVELQIGNRRLARNAIDFTAVANEAGIFSVSDIEFTDNLQGVNDDGATVTCLVSHKFWGPEPIKSASDPIEVLYLPEEVEVVYAGEQGAVAYALEGQEVEISCQAVSNPKVNLELHEGQYAPPQVPEAVEEVTQAVEVESEAEEQDSQVEDQAEEDADEEVEAENEAEDEAQDEAEDEAEDQAEDEADALLTNSRRRRNATDEATAAPATAAPVEVVVAPTNPTVSRSAVRGQNIEYSCRAYDAQFNFNIWSQAVSLPVYYLDAPVLSGPSGKQSPNTEINFSCASENFVGDNEVTYTLMLGEEVQATQSTPDFTVEAAQGPYSCSVAAANVEGLSAQTSDIVDVELKNVCQYSSARPKIEYSSKTKGDKLVSTLTCPLLAGSEDCVIEWHYSADKFKAKKADGGQKLVIENLVVSASDRISCLAKNEAGASQRVWLDNGDVKEIEAKSNKVVIFIIVAILLVVIYVAFAKYRAKKSHEKKMAAAAEESVSLRG